MLFKDIIGQDAALGYLRGVIREGKVASAYLFAGREGTGRAAAARSFAKMLNCELKKTEPCDDCSTCRRIESGNFPDLYWVNLGDEEEYIKIDAMRAMRERVYLRPFEAERKVFVIEDADAMRDEAANCVLKTLEEPPLDTTIILIAQEPSGLLPTIVSRCKVVKFLPLARKDIEAALGDEPGIDEPMRSCILNFAEGSIGKARELASSEIFRKKNEIIDEFAQAHETGENYKKEEFLDALRILYSWYRDMLISRCGLPELAMNSDRRADLAEYAGELPLDEILRRVSVLEDTNSSVRFNANIGLAREALSVRLNR